MNRKPRALTDRIMVRLHEKQTEVSGGLIEIPAAVQEAPQTGDVVSVGPDVVGIEPGEEIVFQRGAGTTIKVNGEELQVMRIEQVYAVI